MAAARNWCHSNETITLLLHGDREVKITEGIVMEAVRSFPDWILISK
jgi:hypothetical protein